ncbi:MAG: hypothetical protein WBE89_15035 [Methyloceanibacter sp.]
MNGPVTLDSVQKIVTTGAERAQRQAQLSPGQQKLLANRQAAKARREINRQLTDWIIDFTARRKRREASELDAFDARQAEAANA